MLAAGRRQDVLGRNLRMRDPGLSPDSAIVLRHGLTGRREHRQSDAHEYEQGRDMTALTCNQSMDKSSC
jgi:hypothetical protein